MSSAPESSRKRSGGTETNRPSASAQSESPANSFPLQKIFRPSLRSHWAVKRSSVCSGVGRRYLIVSDPVMPGVPDSAFAKPSTSSNAAAT